jgi:hypothetical protein
MIPFSYVWVGAPERAACDKPAPATPSSSGTDILASNLGGIPDDIFPFTTYPRVIVND